MSVDKDLVFIVSGGRTGTQFFGDGLSAAIEGCHSIHEPDVLYGMNARLVRQVGEFGFWHMLIGRLLGVSSVRMIGQRRLTGALSEDDCLARIRRFRDAYYRRIAEPLIVESNYQWWCLVDEIQRVWPTAKVIAIIRDPRSWVRSCLNKGSRYDRSDLVQLMPPGRLTPAKLGQADWAERWRTLDPFGKLAWEWRTIYGHLDRNIGRNRSSRMFRFEDVFSGAGPAMQELVAFASTHDDRRYRVRSLDGFSDVIRNASSGSEVEWYEWPPDRARLIDELCGPLMRRYGYGEEPEWREKLR